MPKNIFKSMEVRIIIDGVRKLINTPEKWSDVKLKHWMKLNVINKKEWELAIIRDINIVAAILDITPEEVEMLDTDTYNILMDSLSFLLKEPEDEPLKDFIEIKGEKWWIKKDFDKITLGERITIDTLLMENTIEERFSTLLTLFLKKKLDNGEFETWRTSHKERAILFEEEVNFMDVKNIMIFFSDGISLSSENMKESSVKKKPKRKKKVQLKEAEK
jgi:hypothetical protein